MSDKDEMICEVHMKLPAEYTVYKVQTQLYCPICATLMHEYFLGDDKTRYRCMACETKVEVGR